MTVRPYLSTVGRFTVEQVPCPHFPQPVNLAGPRTGVIHTTEGPHVEDALGVFRQHFAPQFLVGPGRILQLVQVGTIGAALVHHNADTIVQVEVVGFSKQAPWFFDDPTAEALSALLAVCQREYGIPLTHPWSDGDYGLYGDNPHRHADKWGVVAGWYGHGDVPEPDEHWDPGALQWSKLFALAAAHPEALGEPSTPPVVPARPCACHPTFAEGSTSWVQTIINSLGHNPPLVVDGVTGSGTLTEAAIKSFQSAHGLGVDGIAGDETISALKIIHAS